LGDARREALVVSAKNVRLGRPAAQLERVDGVLVYVAVVMSFTVPLMILPSLSEPGRAGGDVAIWLVLMVVTTLTFFRLCWVKTDG